MLYIVVVVKTFGKQEVVETDGGARAAGGREKVGALGNPTTYEYMLTPMGVPPPHMPIRLPPLLAPSPSRESAMGYGYGRVWQY